MDPKCTFRVLFNRRNKDKSRAGHFPVEIEAYQPVTRIRRYIPTFIKVKPAHWDQLRNEITYKNANYISLNNRIKEMIQEFNSIEEEYRLNKIPFHLDYLDRKPKEHQQISFTGFFANYIKTNPKKQKPNTIRHKLTALRHFKGFRPEVLFPEFDRKMLDDYENYLLDYGYIEKGEYKTIGYGYIHSLLKDLKAVLNVAIDQELIPIEKSPFLKFNLEKYAKASKEIKYLLPEEVTAIENLTFDYSNSRLIKIRDFFLLGVYTGLRYGDLIRLNNSHIIESEGDLTVKINQEKTGELVTIPLSEMFKGKGVTIIKAYRAYGRKFFFDELSNGYLNRELKVLAAMAGIDKNLTSHMARHTFGTYLLSHGLQIQFVQEVMGHESIRSTMKYAKVQKQALRREMKLVKF